VSDLSRLSDQEDFTDVSMENERTDSIDCEMTAHFLDELNSSCRRQEDVGFR